MATTGHFEFRSFLPRIAAFLVTAPVAIAPYFLASARVGRGPVGWVALAALTVAAFLVAVGLTYPIFGSVAINN